MSELLDLKVDGDFSFRMSSVAKRGDKEELQADCGRVVDLAKATVKDMCLLAGKLYQMKQKGHWENVINPKTGFAFYNNTFADFCEYTFGFSKTKTSDLLRISQFVNPIGEIEDRYKDYNTSQLIELASVPPSHRVYFDSDMSVAEMRVAKDYVKNSAGFIDEKKKVGFDLLAKAQEWKENGRTSEPASNPDVMDGQLSIFPEDNEEDEDNSPEHQEYLKESEPWIEGTDEKKEQAIKIALIDRTGTIRRQRIYEKYQQRPLQSEFVKFLKEEYGNSGWCVCGLNGSTDFKGYRITPSRGAWGIFMSWHTVASHIVSFINTGEYFPERNEETDDGAGVSNPTSDLAELGEEIIEEEIERGYTNDVDEYDELDEAQEDMRADMETIEQEAEESVSGEYRFGARAHVRDFISDYQAWPGRCGHFFLSPCWRYSLKNGAVIYAMTYDSFVDFSENITTKRVLYFLQEKGSKTIEISKEQFERWCSEHKQEL